MATIKRAAAPAARRQASLAAAAPLASARSAPRRRAVVTVRAASSAGLGRAVVIGTGMGGLVAAQRLSRHFDEVVCLERDAAPSQAADGASPFENGRPGVAQFTHVHALLGQGARVLEDSFGPAFREAVLAAGGYWCDWYTQARIVVPPGDSFLASNPAAAASWPIGFYSSSRKLLEGAARGLLQSNPKVKITYGVQATGYDFGPAGDGVGPAVRGVRLAGGDVVGASLVVDATGRGARGPEWLAAGGYDTPPVRTVDANVGYVSRHYRLSPAGERLMGNLRLLVALPVHPYNQIAVLQRVEGGDWLFGVAAAAAEGKGVWPPRGDDDGAGGDAVAAWMKDIMWWPEVARILEGATPLAPASRFFGIKNTRRMYDAIDLPDGLAFVGDSLTSFNPVYGQGMTVAAMEAHLLESQLAARLAAGASGGAALAGLGKEHAVGAAKIIDEAWDLAAGMDLLAPWATGTEPRGPVHAAKMAYMIEALRLSCTDAEVHEAMGRVWHMTTGSAALKAPAIAAKVVSSLASRWVAGLKDKAAAALTTPAKAAAPMASPAPTRR